MSIQPALFETNEIRRVYDETSESVTNCHRLKLPAADGKNYLTDVANAETLLRHFSASSNNLPRVTR
jgi:hypothetical protein